jgi:hypothetical protein
MMRSIIRKLRMQKVKILLALLITVSYGCSNSSKEKENAVKKVKEREHFNRGMINPVDESSLKIVKISAVSPSDGSVNYLRADNYFADQFSCVVHGYSYYRLTNVHPSSTITGCVMKSWLFEGKTVYENVAFTLRPKEWQVFGCFFVTASQPITFRICSSYGTVQHCTCSGK